MERTRFFGLLYVPRGREMYANLRASSPLDIYLRCAALCEASARLAGFDFAVITNDAEDLACRAKKLKLEISIIQFDFKWRIPHGLAFQSAHYKLELIEAFGKGLFGDYVGLVDLDVVFVSSWPRICGSCFRAYDISEQVMPVYGKARIERELEVVSQRCLKQPSWYGGEFLCGRQHQFEILSKAILKCWPEYLRRTSSLHHVGDEMVLSAALNVIRAEGMTVHNAADENLIARWWSGRVQHDQPSFFKASKVAVLHLPSDKVFLSSFQRLDINIKYFSAIYRVYAYARAASNILLRVADRIRK